MVAYSFKRRFADPIRVGLGVYRGEGETALRAAWPAAKRQTIRQEGKRRHAHPGETLQLYCGMRTKHCFKIGEARCTGIQDVQLYINADKVVIVGDRALRGSQLHVFAQRDGFESWGAMQDFWRAEHPDMTDLFAGKLISWEPIAGT